MLRTITWACLVGLVACQPDDGYVFDLPPNFPEPRVPDDNPMSDVKVELGRHLFYDVRLSGNQTQSCASCHARELAFTDGLPVSIGSTGDMTPRGSMSLVNVAYAATLTWANPVLRHLEDQALVPMFGEEPVELGLANMEDELIERLRAEPRYQELFGAAFSDSDPFTIGNVTKAIGAFQRTILSSGEAPYDRYLAGDESAISEAARRGAAAFFEEEAECFHCHGGFLFSSSVDHMGNVFDQATFLNNGLYNIDGRGQYPASNTGLFEHTGMRADYGKFKPPTLRNIAVTGPYMHDGSVSSLDEALAIYQAGGRNIEEGENIGDGRLNPNKSLFVNGFPEELAPDIRAFLDTLTDDVLLNDPRFGDPWLEPFPGL